MQDKKTTSYILLTLPDVSLRSPVQFVTGTLSLECISSPPTHTTQPKNSDREAYIVLHVEGHSFPIDPAVPISLSVSASGERTYSFRPSSSNAEKGPSPSNVSLILAGYSDDVEMFDNILAQYADVSESSTTALPAATARSQQQQQPPPSYQHATGSPSRLEGMHVDDPSLRGRLVLMDESSGEVLGELPERLSFKEDPALSAEDKRMGKGEEAGPVVLELPEDVYDAYTGGNLVQVEGEDLVETREVFVRAIPPEEQDWLTTSATVISQVISASTSLLLSGITSASTYYISHSAPYTPPPPSSSSVPRAKTPTPHPALTQAHVLSDKAAKASAVTAAYVGDLIRRAVGGKVSESGPVSSPSTSRPTTPISASYPVYKPKPRLPTGPPPTLPPRSREVSPSPWRNTSSPDQMQTSEERADQSRKPLRTRDRVLLSANLVLATVDDSAKRMFEVGSERLGAVVGHKYGPQAQQSTHLATHTAKNVVLVYVDVSGFARRALITKAGKEWVKAKVGAKHVDADVGSSSGVVATPSSTSSKGDAGGGSSMKT